MSSTTAPRFPRTNSRMKCSARRWLVMCIEFTRRTTSAPPAPFLFFRHIFGIVH